MIQLLLVNHRLHLPLHLKQRQLHHPPNLVVRGRQTTKKVVTALTRTSAVYVSGLTKRMLSKTPALIGYSVHARDGSMKSVLIMIYIGHNADGNDLLCLFCCV